MKNIEKLEKEAEENLIIAENEIKVARLFKEMAKLESKKSKAREKLLHSELKIAKTRENLAKRKKELSTKKKKFKDEGILIFSDDELRGESNYAIFYENLAKKQLELARIHEKIDNLEKKIIKNKYAISKIRSSLAKELKLLTKKINKYIKTVGTNKSPEKISKAETQIHTQRKQVEIIKGELFEKENKLKIKHNMIADLNKELSLNLAEQEKIRHQKS